MSETVKVIWDGTNRLGISIRPKQTVYFNPGTNEVPAEDWKALTETKRDNPRPDEPELLADDPGGLNHHLKGGKLRLAIQTVQGVVDIRNVAEMEWRGAVEVVKETIDRESVEQMERSEQVREAGPRSSVMKAIKDQLAMLIQLDGPKPQEDQGGRAA